MKAVVVNAPGKFSYEDVADPTPADQEVVLAVRACGICGTDLHILEGDLGQARYPIIPGHEFAGEVVAVGRGVVGIESGTLACADPNLPCGHCRQCRRGRVNLCENYNAIGVTVNGAAAEFVAVPARTVRLLPAGSDASLGALVEPLSCVVHAYDLVQSRIGERFLIYGAGTMGLMLLIMARAGGALSTTVVEPHAARAAIARSLGANQVVAGDRDLDGGATFDLVIDATGVVAAIEDGLARVGRGGTYLQFGVAPAQATASFSPFRLYNDELTILGAMAVLNSYDRALDILIDGSLDFSQLLSQVLPLESYAEAVQRVRDGQGCKIQVAPFGRQAGAPA